MTTDSRAERAFVDEDGSSEALPASATGAHVAVAKIDTARWWHGSSLPAANDIEGLVFHHDESSGVVSDVDSSYS